MAAAEPQQVIELDSNYAVAALGEDSPQNRELAAWLQNGVLVQMSAIAWSEYLCGPLPQEKARATRRMLSAVDPFTEADGKLASELFNASGRRSRSHVDCMIAAHAIRRDALLATLNVRDFRRFESLQLTGAT